MLDIKKVFDILKEKYNDCSYDLFWYLYDISRENNANEVYDILEDYITDEDEYMLGCINLQYKIEERDFCYKIIAKELNKGAK